MNLAMLARYAISLVVALAIAVGAHAPARAQTRMTTTAIPDLQFWAAGGPHALNWQLGGGLAQQPGSDGVPLLGFAALRWGKRFGSLAQLRLASTMDLTRSTQGPADETRPALIGSHRLAAETVLQSVQSRSGVDAFLDGWLTHTWGKRRALAAIDIGPGSYTRGGLRVGFAPFHQPPKDRRSGVTLQVPVSYEVDHLIYHDPTSPIRRGLRHGVSVGLGPRGFNRHVLHGSMEIVGVTVAQTKLTPRSGTTDMAPTMNVAELRLADIDAAFHIGGLTLATRVKLGTAMADLGGEESVELFTMDYGFQLRGPKGFAGLGVTAAPRLSPSGEQLLTSWRAELMGGWTAAKHGGELRLVGEWSADAYDESRDLIQRYGVHSEVYRRVGKNLQLGAYSLASHEAQVRDRSMDLWAAQPRWATELGVFLRVRGTD